MNQWKLAHASLSAPLHTSISLSTGEFPESKNIPGFHPSWKGDERGPSPSEFHSFLTQYSNDTMDANYDCADGR